LIFAGKYMAAEPLSLPMLLRIQLFCW